MFPLVFSSKASKTPKDQYNSYSYVKKVRNEYIGLFGVITKIIKGSNYAFIEVDGKELILSKAVDSRPFERGRQIEIIDFQFGELVGRTY